MIESLWRALPARTLEEIADKMNTQRDVSGVTRGDVAAYLGHLRRRVDQYGWTVPHVKRGTNVDGGKRFLRMLVDPDGTRLLDEGNNTIHLLDGAAATISQIATLASNESAALKVAIEHTRSINLRRRLREFVGDFAYMKNKAELLGEAIEEERNGTTG